MATMADLKDAADLITASHCRRLHGRLTSVTHWCGCERTRSRLRSTEVRSATQVLRVEILLLDSAPSFQQPVCYVCENKHSSLRLRRLHPRGRTFSKSAKDMLAEAFCKAIQTGSRRPELLPRSMTSIFH
jgi:hypothetical protein